MSALLWNRSAVDWTIATALVPLQKQQARVVHDRDDLLLEQYVREAISIVEKRANINLVVATYEAIGTDLTQAFAWAYPHRCYIPGSPVLLPFNNVREVRLFDALAAEITPATWSIAQQTFGGNAEAYLVGSGGTDPLAGAASAEIDVGVEAFADIDPAVMSVVLRLGAALYENRESDQPLTDTVFVASRFDGEISSIWRPTV